MTVFVLVIQLLYGSVIMVYQIDLAGTIFGIETKYNHVPSIYKDYVTNKKPDYIIRLSQSELDAEWTRSREYDGLLHSRRYICMEPIVEINAIIRKICNRLPNHSIFLMHGAVVAVGKSAFMFTAPSGVGKTTRARLFLEQIPGSYILNGDKPLIRIESDKAVVCGSPWNGKECLGINAEADLKAVFLLERSTNTVVTELSSSDAFEFLFKQTYMPSEALEQVKTISHLRSMDRKVRFFRFQSTPTADSVLEAWKAVQ